MLTDDVGDDHIVDFMNNHILVRGTPVQQVAIRSAISTYRVTIRSLDDLEARAKKILR